VDFQPLLRVNQYQTDTGILKIDANGNWQAVGEGFVAITAKALGAEKGDMLKVTIFFSVKPVLSSKVEILGEHTSKLINALNVRKRI
jgi:hypothetical protein